eukprot:jgi/Botrbrau1/7885/Bobra.9_2s0059.2
MAMARGKAPTWETPEGSVHGGRARISSGLQTTLRISTSGVSSTKGPPSPNGGSNPSTRGGRGPLDRPSASTSAALPAVYSAQWLSRAKMRAMEEHNLPFAIVHPRDIMNLYWFIIVLLASVWTGIYVPFVMAFEEVPGLYPYKDFWAFLQYIFFVLFLVDMLFKFRVAYYDDQVLVTDTRRIAQHYLRTWFFVDLIAWIPFDMIVLTAMCPHGQVSPAARYASLLSLLHLLRLYRVGIFFRYMEYNLTVNLVVTTVVRNSMITFYSLHWGACIFFFIARQYGLGENTWVYLNEGFLLNQNNATQYVFSLYWSITTLAGVGYGDWHPVNAGEAVFVICYMFYNLWLISYILGTITLLVVKHDERAGKYRERSENLKNYANINGIPKELKESMQAHLRLHFANEEAADEAVLSAYPSTIRRRLLRHLYLEQLRSCYLFQGCRQKFLDAVLSIAKVELFMPKVEVVAEGDHINEIFVVVAGELEILKPGEQDLDDTVLAPDGNKSVHLGERAILTEGDVFGEVAYFTEVPQMESVVSMSVCRILAIPRARYETLCQDFPIGARTVLENLKRQAQQLVDAEFRGTSGRCALLSATSQVKYAGASTEGLGERSSGGSSQDAPAEERRSSEADRSFRPGASNVRLTPTQERTLGNLLRIRALVTSMVAKQDEKRTEEFLSAAARGDTSKVRAMLQQGFAPDSADYDGRTALMLAAAKGHSDVVLGLVSAGANPQLMDNLGSNAVLEAVKHDHVDIVRLLRGRGAKIGQEEVKMAADLCTCVFECDLPLLRRFLQAGANPNSGDYDQRTAMHIAAAEGNVAAVRVLVDDGKADIGVKDRWGATPLDEAIRVGAKPVAQYLTGLSAPVGKETDRIMEFLYASSTGDVETIRHMLQNGFDPNKSDYDKRTALMLACVEGHKDVVNTLLGAGADVTSRDNFGGCALLEACKGKHGQLIELLAKNGATLSWDEGQTASELCNCVYKRDMEMLQAYLQAGAKLDSGDYDKRTALHIAASEGLTDMVRLLVEIGGADLSVTDRWGATPLDEALREKHMETVDYLRTMGAPSKAFS